MIQQNNNCNYNIKLLTLSLMLFLVNVGNSQTIVGNLSLLANQEIYLEGFLGLKNYPISKTTIDQEGNFKLTYTQNDYGMGYLKSSDNKPFFVILSGEDIEIIGQGLSIQESLKLTKGQENLAFELYVQQQPRREQALSAWVYLEKIYSFDTLFSKQKTPQNAILTEKQRIKQEENNFLSNLPKNSFVHWFLPMRKLVSTVSTIAQYRTEEIPSTIATFRALDYTDQRLYKSGLFKDAIEAHFWLLENSGKNLDDVYTEMRNSIDAMFETLIKDEQKLNEATDFLFDLLERHSLFNASEYLALKVLNEVSCTLNNDLAKQLETYRSMKKGNTATDIVFPKIRVNPLNNFNLKKLSDFETKYTLVVFAASWCPKCNEEVPELAKFYATWKKQGVEVLLVSLDENQKVFYDFTSNLPFISITDLQKWESPIVKDYHVFGTPTMYLLDKNRKIMLRPNSVKQMEAWVDWYLVQGNLISN